VSPVGVLGAIVNLNHPAHTVDWSFVHLSVANVVVIVLMLVVFVLAILLPFPGGGAQARRGIVSVAPPPSGEGATAHPDTWTVRVREAAVEALPPEKLLPDGQPTYVASWIYVFGVASIASLIVIIASGSILALKGPRLVARHRRRAFLQQHPYVERRAVLPS